MLVLAVDVGVRASGAAPFQQRTGWRVFEREKSRREGLPDWTGDAGDPRFCARLSALLPLPLAPPSSLSSLFLREARAVVPFFPQNRNSRANSHLRKRRPRTRMMLMISQTASRAFSAPGERGFDGDAAAICRRLGELRSERLPQAANGLSILLIV